MHEIITKHKCLNNTENMDENQGHNTKESEDLSSRKPTSMSSLIVWNVSKVLDNKPYIDLKRGLKVAQECLELDTRDVNTIISQNSEERHLACAFLAWQQLGHNDSASLYRYVSNSGTTMNPDTLRLRHGFIEEKKKNNELLPKNETHLSIKTVEHKESQPPKHFCCSSLDSHLVGPVVKLPIEPKTVLRLDCSHNSRPVLRKSMDNDLINKIDACCLDSDCVDRLAELDSVTKELRSRAGRLARREAERVELLERAEAAWRDLELGFQRRLLLAEEKEEDMTKQIQKLIEDRNGFKNGCLLAAELLKNRSDAAEKDRNGLQQKEKELCERACTRLRLSEESARTDSSLAEQQCAVALLERDLQFKEEQASRKVSTLEGEVEAARTLTHEAERALRAELGAIKEQITQVSVQLIDEDTKCVAIKSELTDLREEKMEIVEDLEGCKVLCDGRMQGKVDELMKKREKLSEIKNQVLECRCKLPVDVAVEVKRTPSLAAMCRCAPEDKLLDSCSCTSLRSQLLSNLLADLFGGLQSELGNNGSQMPCKLLKCLEDNHNWDRASIVKSNLRSFFSQLLIGELDIAIATSIENYHAKWVGASCADVAKLTPSPGETEDEGWQERALERRAQKLATKLAEQLFQEKADQLAQRAKDIVTSGPPPCECKPQSAVYQCLVKPNPIGAVTTCQETDSSAYWRRTQQDVTLLRVQIEDLKKASIKKADLKLMEDKITKIVKRTSASEPMKPAALADHLNRTDENIKRENKIYRVLNAEQDYNSNSINDKQYPIKRKQLEKNNNQRKGNKNHSSPNESIEKCSKSFKRRGQSFAVNLCLCSQKDLKKLPQQDSHNQKLLNNDRKMPWKQKPSHNEVAQLSSIKQTKPITACLPSQELINLDDKKSSAEPLCKSNCACLNKIPSNTSIDKLLETLAKWKCDLIEPRENKSIINDQILNKSCSKDCNVLKHIDSPIDKIHVIDQDLKINKSPLKLSSMRMKRDTEDCFDSYNQLTQELSKSTELELPIPASKESEYMGAVNLDKSNEHFCKCIKSKRDLINDSKCSYKSTKLDAYDCAKLLDNANNLYDKNLHLKDEDTKINSEMSNTNAKHIRNIDDVKKPGLKKVLQTELFPHGCDYFIKFLGVTLANTDSNKVFNSTDENDDGSPFVNKINESRLNNLQPKKDVKLECPTYNNQRGDYIVNEDKALDIQSFKDISEKIQECICCEIDGSKDLEVNTFHLLEEHLKEKLEEFKQSTCKSSCISPSEEEKIFSSIFQKVKHVITESKNKIACKCSKDMQSQGSWNRAYGLLQEYLKIKIKRVQCLCVSSNESKDVILPDVLEKVCTMIEQDFQRLQNICICNTNGPVAKSVCLEKPVKDISRNVYTVSNYTNDKMSQQISKSIIPRQNISSQVSNNLGMDTKSCDAMEKGTKLVQTLEPNNKKSMKSCQFSQLKHKDCNCDSSLADKSSKVSSSHCTDLTKKKEYCRPKINVGKKKEKCSSCPVFNEIENACVPKMEHSKDDKREDANTLHIDDNSKIQLNLTKHNLPYVGYTINCTCDSKLGTCICTKSIVLADNDKINTFWKKIIADTARSCDVSYVMKGPQNTVDDNYKNLNIHNTNTHETEICILSKDGRKSKDSLQRKYTSNNTTNTFDQRLNIGTDCFHNDEPIDWHDCGSQMHTNLTIDKNNEFESLYFPATLSNHKSQGNSEIQIDNGMKSNSVSSNCECNMVPICHVKMLVENIENKLIHSQCTCDSLTSKVCPIHSKAIN